MLFRRIRNISFRKKMTLIFAVVCTFATCIVGILYYKFAENEIVKNFTANAESLVSQLGNTLDTRLEAVNRRAFAALTNQEMCIRDSSKSVYGRHAIPRIRAFFKVPFNVFSNRAI